MVEYIQIYGKVMFEPGLLPPPNCSKLNERNVPRNCETSKKVAVFTFGKVCTSIKALQEHQEPAEWWRVMWEQVRR